MSPECDDADKALNTLQSIVQSVANCRECFAIEDTDSCATDASVQTALSKDPICAMERDNRTRLVEATPTSDTCGVYYTREWYEGQTEKVTSHTGVPCLAVLDILYNIHIAPHLTALKLDNWQQLLLCLVKL